MHWDYTQKSPIWKSDTAQKIRLPLAPILAMECGHKYFYC